MIELNITPTRNNIIVENPVKPRKVSTIKLTPEMEAKADQEWQQEQLANAEKAVVLEAGAGCIEVKKGDIVRIKGARFMQAEPLENGKYLLFTEGDVIAIYRTAN